MFARLETVAGLIVGTAVVLFGVAMYRKMGGAAGLAVSLNPANPENIVNQGVNKVVTTLTGDPNQTAGGWLNDLLNPSAGLAENETLNADGSISVKTIQQVLPAAGMGDDNAWWFGGGYAQTPAGAVTGIVRKP